MARKVVKKKRRLKKRVRVGCALLSAIPLLCFLWLLLRGLFSLPFFKATETKGSMLTHTSLSGSATTLSHRLDSLFSLPNRLDTATIAVEVYDIQSGQTLYSRHAHRLAPPASCMKLITAVAAMRYMGFQQPYLSTVSVSGEQTGATLHGTVCITIDDDPQLESMEPLVEALCRNGIRNIDGDIQIRLTRPDTLKAHPTAAFWDIPYNRLPITLKGSDRILRDLQYLFTAKGINYSSDKLYLASSAPSSQKTFREIFRLETPLTDVLAPMLIHSSNIKADALFQHMERIAVRVPLADFGESRWLLPLLSQVEGYRSDFVINDGSGLSPDNRLTAHFLVGLLRYAYDREPMRNVLIDEALATPAHPIRHGSLLGRMRAPEYRNRIFVKTGTLTTIGLSSLAGYAQTSDGRWLIFSIINEDSPVAESRMFQDRLCREFVK